MPEVRKLGTGGNLLEDREDFFELDGVTYTLPRKIPSSVTLRFLEELEAGVSEAELMAWALDEIIGEGVYKALRDSDRVSNDELVWVMDQVGDRVMGELEKNQGKSRNGSRRSAGS
jgi:hypothetical protein